MIGPFRLAQFRQFAIKDFPHRRILVAQVDVTRLRFHGPCSDEHTFEKTMRVRLQIVAILEGAGFTLVRIDRQQAGTRITAHDPPLTAGGKSSAPHPAQLSAVERCYHLVDGQPTIFAFCQDLITTAVQVRSISFVVGDARRVLVQFGCGHHFSLCSATNVMRTHCYGRGGITMAHARRP